MYQITFIRDGKIHSVTTPNKIAAEWLRILTPKSRLWQSMGKGNYSLIA